MLPAPFVSGMAARAHRDEAMPYGGISFAAPRTTLGQAVYYRTSWGKPRVVTAREGLPLLRRVGTIGAEAAGGLAVGVAFPELNTSGQLVVRTLTFGTLGMGST